MIFLSTLIEKHIARYLRAHSKCRASTNRRIWFKWNLETFNFNRIANRKLFLLSASRRTQILSLRIFSRLISLLHWPNLRFYSSVIQFNAIRSLRLIVIFTMVFAANNSLNSIMIFSCSSGLIRDKLIRKEFT